MDVKIINSGIIPTAGRPPAWGFWEDVKVGRFKAYLDYVYLDTPGEMEEVPTEVRAHVYTTDWRFVGTWLVGEVRTSLIIKEIRVRISRNGLERLDEIMRALQHWILEGVEQHADMA